jgi:HAD superfamily hydrolase (TIGR01509 family)
MLNAILFDLGDTLLDFEQMHSREVFEQAGRQTYDWLQKRGHSLPPFRTYFRSQVWAVRWAYLWSTIRRREFNCYDLLHTACRRMKIELSESDKRELAWQWYLPVTLRASVAPDVVPTLAKLRDRGLRLGLVSNTFLPGFVLDRHLEIHGLLDFFPVRIYSSEIGYCKPHPRIFQAALGAIGTSPENTLFVGDLVKKDILGAQRMGMRAVLRQRRSSYRFHPIANFVIRGISELHQVISALETPAAEELPLEALVPDA